MSDLKLPPEIEPGEEWRPISDFPGYYVSNMGRVGSNLVRRNKGRKWLPGRVYVGSRFTNEIIVLCPVKNKYGYLYINLYIDRKLRNRRIHRLVLEAFNGPCPKGMEGCHGPNFDTHDNRLSNLRWDTPKSNCADRTMPDMKGSNSPTAILDEARVLEIKKLLRDTTMSQVEISKLFGVTNCTISNISRGTQWKHVVLDESSYE